MRLSTILAVAAVFLAAAVLSFIAARVAVGVIEESSRIAVRDKLDGNGLTWAQVDADGLNLFLAGTAPSEAVRFKALSLAGTVVDAARVIDQMLVVEQDRIEPPRFSMEILRNDSGVSLIGLVPAAMDRAAFLAEVEKAAAGAPMADFLEAADYPMPKTWRTVTAFALRPLKDLERSKISIDAGRVAITAMAGSAAEKADIEAQLARRVPEGVRLALDISAPRPVIAPFALRFVIADGAARFDACVADTEAARARIVAAATAAGLKGRAGCLIGLGVPSPRWAEAAEKAIAALADLGAGAVTFSDADISLVAADSVPQSRFDDVVGALQSALPEVFSLHAVLSEPPEETTAEEPEFTATLSPEGLVQLRGRVGAGERDLIDSFARARFSSDGVHMAARAAGDLPEGWSLRVLAALDALSRLSHGVARVSPDELSVSGATGKTDAGTTISGLLSEKLGKGARFSIDIDYIEALDPVASLPTPEECEARIAAVQQERKIGFEPGSANIDIDGAGVIDAIAAILKECGDITLEIGGHTDSQGREVMNQQLSLARARTVLNELRMRRVLAATLTAVGYGESQPIADNGTEQGREKNRRIAFRIVTAEDGTAGQSALATGAGTSEERQTAVGAGDVAQAEPAGAGAAQGDTRKDGADEPD